MPTDLVACIENAAAERDAALWLPAHRGTWTDLCELAVDAAEWLRGLGVGEGDVVAVVSEPELPALAAILGAWKLNAAVSVLATADGAKRSAANYGDWLTRRLAQIGAKVVVAASDLPLSWEKAEEAWLCPVAPAKLTVPAAILQLTSGSTGEPRIVPVTASAIVANVSATVARLDLDHDDSVVSWLPLNHDMGLIGTFLMPALTGLPLQLSTPDSFVRSPLSWLMDIGRRRATVTFAPHFAYGLAARLGRIRRPALDLSSMRHFLNGSEPINSTEFADFGSFAEEHGMPRSALRPGYGMAEVGLVLTLPDPAAPLRSLVVDGKSLVASSAVLPSDDGVPIVSCGRPLSGYEVTIRSGAGSVVGEGVVGEICVTGPSLFAGYLGVDPAGSFWPDGSYRTGDLGFLSDGEVFVCGRIKDVIIVRGENLVPQEIERKVAEVDGIRLGNVAAVGIQSWAGAEGLVVIAETAGHDDLPALKSSVAHTVRDWFGLRPLDVVLLPQGKLPKTTSGKLQRQLCRQTYLRGEWSH
jgi:fatty-acyl-CoA synthase